MPYAVQDTECEKHAPTLSGTHSLIRKMKEPLNEAVRTSTQAVPSVQSHADLGEPGGIKEGNREKVAQSQAW